MFLIIDREFTSFVIDISKIEIHIYIWYIVPISVYDVIHIFYVINELSHIFISSLKKKKKCPFSIHPCLFEANVF